MAFWQKQKTKPKQITPINYTLKQAPPHDPARQHLEPYGLQWNHDRSSGIGVYFFWLVCVPFQLVCLLIGLAAIAFVLFAFIWGLWASLK